MKKLQDILILVALFAIAGCTQNPMATIEGCINGAEGKTLYLDFIGLEHTTVADSVKLEDDGVFRFRVAQPECFDFYRLRVEQEVIYLSVDSTETIGVVASWPALSLNYQVTGSDDNVTLKRLVNKQSELQNTVYAFIRNSRDGSGAIQAYVDTLIDRYKDEVRMEYVYADPSKPYAYFALFQRLGGNLIFDPVATRDDIRCFAAVATQMKCYYPEAARTRNIESIALKGMGNIRPPRIVDYESLKDKIVESSIIDVVLPDIDGTSRVLTELKGKVVLLDFMVYDHIQAASRILALRDLYEKYSDSGLEIYQISLDENEHFWKTVVENLPWICVRDEEALYSKSARLYGVRELPTYFLVDRAGELVARDSAVEDLEKEICRLLEK